MINIVGSQNITMSIMTKIIRHQHYQPRLLLMDRERRVWMIRIIIMMMTKGQGKKTLERFRGESSTLAGVRLGGLEL